MTKNFAHRGFSGKYPENTLLAFSKAIEEGVDGIENDVHLTKDGVLVVMHDELVDRTTNGKGYIKDKTYEELAQLDASYIFKEYGPQKVPTLREYLELVKDTDIITNIELKTTWVVEVPTSIPTLRIAVLSAIVSDLVHKVRIVANDGIYTDSEHLPDIFFFIHCPCIDLQSVRFHLSHILRRHVLEERMEAFHTC